MPSSPSDHSRLSGDVISCTLAFLSIILLASVPFALAPRQQTVETPAAVQHAQAAQPVSLSTDKTQASAAPARPKGVDLLAFVGLNGDKTRLYELSTYDRSLYKQIFAAQDKGDMRQANALIKRLHDRVLIGHVLYDRYINATDYKASYDELRDWMVQYNDHPNAYKIYQLAQKRRNNDPQALPAPQIAKKLFGTLELKSLMKNAGVTKQGKIAAASKNRQDDKVKDLVQSIKTRLGTDRVTSAYNLLGSSPVSKTLTAYEYDSLLSEIASAYYYNGKYETALKLTHQAIKRSNKNVPTAHWTAGLSAWQLGDYAVAAKHFESVNQSPSHNPWMLSAGAFWAARAYNKMGKASLSDDWLREAASYPRTFYGLVAQARLGDEHQFSWTAPKFSAPLMAAVRDAPSGKRALALLDIGETTLAQHELMQTHPNGNQRLEKALVAVAHHFNLPALAMRLGNAINQPDGNLYDVALYPMVPWKGDISAGVDPALINALIRQESKFELNANNTRSGATGLMQLMPSTAEFVSDNFFNAKDLHNPEVNVALGQRYVRYLLQMPQVKGNLLYLAAAYNAGPGTLSRWQKNVPYDNDPFLFIESLPWSETRGFIARVMTNYWIYTQRLEQDTASLASLSKEKWPVYTHSSDVVKVASNF